MFVRVIPFVFNSRDSLVLVFRDQLLTFIQDGAPVLSGGSGYSLVTPYLEEDLARLSYVQSGNVVTLTHPSYASRELTRITNSSWTLAAIVFGATIQPPASQSDVSTGYNAAATSVVLATGGGALMPAVPFNAAWWDRTTYAKPTDDPKYEVVTVTARATDTLTVTRAQESTAASTKNTAAKTYAFAAAPSLGFFVVDQDEDLSGWVWVVTAIAADGEESLASRAVEEITAGHANHPIVVSWTATAGASSYRIYRRPPKSSSADVGAYGFVGVSASTKFVDYGRDPDFAQQPPVAKTVFASAGNYPSAAGYWQQRRVFSNTNNNPDTTWASQTARHNNFNISVPLKDDDAISGRLVSDTIDEVRHILAQGELTLLTEGGEWAVRGDVNGAVTPFAFSPRKVSSHGVGLVRPVPASGLLFPQALGSTILGLSVTPAAQYTGTTSRDLTLFSTHLFDGHQIVDMAWQQETPHVAWFVREDGVLLGLTYIPDQDMIAWHRHDMDGSVESVCVVPEVVGLRIEHRVYVAVGRQVDETVRHSVERFASPFSSAIAEEAWFVDGGVEYDGRATLLPASTVDGLDHLEGLDVAVYAYGKITASVPDAIGYVVANPLRADLTVVTVGGGAITLADSYLRILVGLPFIADIETLDIDSSEGATTKTQKTNIGKVGMQLLESRNIWAGAELPDDATPTDEMDPQALSTDSDYDDIVTDFVEINTKSRWDTNGRVALRSIDPTPFTLLSAVPIGYFPNPSEG